MSMINANIDYFNGKTVIEAKGTAKEILADTMALIKSIHHALPERCGGMYKKLLRAAVNQEGAPLWKDEDISSEAKVAVAALLKKIEEGR